MAFSLHRKSSARLEAHTSMTTSSKRPRDDTTHISAPTRILSKRKRVTTDTQPRSTASVCKAWHRLESSITRALAELRAPSLGVIKDRLSMLPSNGQVSAVCITMGAAALAGDRGTVFSSILDEIPNHIRLSSAHHSTIASVMQALQDTAIPVVVAVEDTELFPDDVIRDLVYYCGKRRASEEGVASADSGTPPIALLLGMGTSANALHSALGIEEATMVAHSIVELPHAAKSFEVIVDQVLAKREGVLLSRSLFELVEREFFSRECTVAMIMRTLRKVYTLHFYRQPIADIFCELGESAGGSDDILGNRAIGAVRKALTPQVLDDISNNVCSVASMKERPFSKEDLRNQCVTWFRQLRRWRARCRLLESMFLELLKVCEVRESEWRNGVTMAHSHLRLHLFKAFLVDESQSHMTASSRFQSIIGMRIRKGGRSQLRKIAHVMKDALSASVLATDSDESSLIARLQSFDQKLDDAEKEAKAKSPKKERTQMPSRRAKGAGAAMTLRREALRQVRVEKEKKTSGIQSHRNRLLKIFEDVTKLVGGLSEIPMHEVILFAETSNLQKYTGGMGGSAEPRSALFTAMRKPSSILGTIDSVPDTAVAYRILAEGGRMVSLYDWYNSFAASISAGMATEDAEGNVTIGPIPAAEMQARFARGCSELEFVGVLKYTNRKTDHVLRLAYE